MVHSGWRLCHGNSGEFLFVRELGGINGFSGVDGKGGDVLLGIGYEDFLVYNDIIVGVFGRIRKMEK